MVFGPIVSDRKAITVELKSNSCTGSDFIVNSNSRITGKVFGMSKEALPNISIDLIPLVKAANGYFRISDWTKANGSYELKDIPPGQYFVVVNDKGIPSARQPFSTIYYPGVFDKSQSVVISIGEGDNREGFDIRIPSQLPTRTIQGLLLYADGNPAAGERVSFKAVDNFENDDSALADDQGRFSLKVLQGVAGWLSGRINVSRSKQPPCPEITKLIKDKQDISTVLETNPIRVEAHSDIQYIELRFSFPFCPEKEGKRQ